MTPIGNCQIDTFQIGNLQIGSSRIEHVEIESFKNEKSQIGNLKIENLKIPNAPQHSDSHPCARTERVGERFYEIRPLQEV